MLLGAVLWAAGAAILPWLVRGRRAALDVLAVTVWSAALVSAAAALDSGLSANAVHPEPRGAVARSGPRRGVRGRSARSARSRLT